MSKQTGSKIEKNPLLAPQREKAGPQTYEKYKYQYHWALYRILQEHESGKEYAVFVELHEDVVVVDSLTRKKAKFEFNQIKTDKAAFTVHGLITPKKKGSKSVLGKLLQSCQNQKYSKLIRSINLVATNGFSLQLKKAGLLYDTIKVTDISDKELEAIKDGVKHEIAGGNLPDTLQFIIPSLPEKGFQKFVIGEISTLVNTLFASSFYNSEDIYRVLIDELNKKGPVTYDYDQWEDLLRNKALTSITVARVINQFTTRKDDVRVNTDFNTIASELGLNYLKRKLLKEAFDRYYLLRLGNRSLLQLGLSDKIKELIKSLTSTCDTTEQLVDKVQENLPAKTKAQLSDELQLQAAIICELIIMN